MENGLDLRYAESALRGLVKTEFLVLCAHFPRRTRLATGPEVIDKVHFRQRDGGRRRRRRRSSLGGMQGLGLELGLEES